jgi:hypothetical protein
LDKKETAAILGFLKHWSKVATEPWDLADEINVDFA